MFLSFWPNKWNILCCQFSQRGWMYGVVRRSDLRGAQRKLLAADRIPLATWRTSPVGVMHDCQSGDSALVAWSGSNSSPSCPRVWRAVGLPRVTPGLHPSAATIRCHPHPRPLCLRLPRTSSLQEFGPVTSVDVVTRGPSNWNADPWQQNTSTSPHQHPEDDELVSAYRRYSLWSLHVVAGPAKTVTPGQGNDRILTGRNKL